MSPFKQTLLSSAVFWPKKTAGFSKKLTKPSVPLLTNNVQYTNFNVTVTVLCRIFGYLQQPVEEHKN